MPLHVSSTSAHHQVKIVLYSLWYNHIYRWPSRAQVESPLSIVSSKCIALEVYVEKTMFWDHVLSTDCSKLKQFGSFKVLKLIRHGPEQHNQYSKLLWAGLSSDQIPVQ